MVILIPVFQTDDNGKYWNLWKIDFTSKESECSPVNSDVLNYYSKTKAVSVINS